MHGTYSTCNKLKRLVEERGVCLPPPGLWDRTVMVVFEDGGEELVVVVVVVVVFEGEDEVALGLMGLEG